MCYKVSTAQMDRLKKALGPNYDVRNYEQQDEANAFTHPILPVATVLAPHTVTGMAWRFVPSWSPTLDVKGNLANAKSETLYDLNSYREAAEAGQRCLLFVDGFYETQHVGKNKIPYFITATDDAPFAMGGLWSRWTNRADGTVHEGFTLITTPANELMSEIHNTKERMPLILQRSLWDEWLNEDLTQPQVEKLMKPLPDGLLKAKPLRDIPPPPLTLF